MHSKVALNGQNLKNGVSGPKSIFCNKNHGYGSVLLKTENSRDNRMYQRADYSQKNDCNDNFKDFSDYNDIIAPLDKLII